MHILQRSVSSSNERTVAFVSSNRTQHTKNMKDKVFFLTFSSVNNLTGSLSYSEISKHFFFNLKGNTFFFKWQLKAYDVSIRLTTNGHIPNLFDVKKSKKLQARMN